MSNNNVAVIVRAAGERTEAVSANLVKQQVPAENIVTIHERPFSRAVKRAFEIGIDYRLDWTLCVDADVLLRAGAVQKLISIAEQAPENNFSTQASILDKLVGIVRPGGGHLYRTTFLGEALSYISHSDDIIRPENFVKQQMLERGYRWEVREDLIALHDYEQYYHDIFRKTFVHSRKHKSKIIDSEQLWRLFMASDADYVVALLGLHVGRLYDGVVTIDRDRFPDNIDNLLKLFGLEEKSPLAADALTTDDIERMIAAYTQNPDYIAWDKARRRTFALGKRQLSTLNDYYEANGLFKSTIWLMTRPFNKLRYRLMPSKK